MYERMLNKKVIPTEDKIKEHMGEENYLRLMELEGILNNQYDLNKELKFPFGNNYGWGFKYSHKASHLCYAFFEKETFTIMLQIGDALVPKFEKIYDSLSEYTQELWSKRYPCGKNGGWIHYQVKSSSDLSDILKLINIKKKPNLN